MEANEYDFFFQLEHELGRDLSPWRRRIVARFEKCCLAACEIEEAKSDPLDLTDPTVLDSIKRHTIDFLIAEWLDMRDSPHPGDVIAVTGESYWRAPDGSDEDMPTFRLPIGYKIEGPLLHWDVLSYIDEAGLELKAHRDPELAQRHTHPFGLYLILDHPTITSDTGALLQIAPEQVYLPIHYERAQLKRYPDD